MLAAPAVAQALDTAAMESCLKAAAEPAAKYACIGRAAAACEEKPGGDTTAGMGDCLGAERDWWKARLTDTYDRLEAVHKESDATVADLPEVPPQAPALEAAQKAWLAWREAECAYQQGFFAGGSAAGPAALSCEMTLTAQRAIDLGASLLQAKTQ